MGSPTGAAMAVEASRAELFEALLQDCVVQQTTLWLKQPAFLVNGTFVLIHFHASALAWLANFEQWCGDAATTQATTTARQCGVSTATTAGLEYRVRDRGNCLIRGRFI
ncbi:hypothetical protein F1559_001732 [Cyanidiococcus yangmingshanensis]|uniref:Uncharacterized protein n=1 Tax=Cyanidiococcus yangmingshanensis TaxID=2690220 RepID=A0A7J7IRI1_9RHOD|nr:hypothetical protein F1559_001732 [Cyanidiococcus yangmingshanensis]